MMASRAAAWALCIGLLAGPAAAVERAPSPKTPPAAEKAPANAAPTPAESAPPYEAQLTRLSELMGALAYMRNLCGYGDGGEYRARMSALLDAEASEQERRARLVGAFNRGYDGYQTTYRTCTPNARLVIARFVDEGEKIAREISYRFGGQ